MEQYLIIIGIITTISTYIIGEILIIKKWKFDDPIEFIHFNVINICLSTTIGITTSILTNSYIKNTKQTILITTITLIIILIVILFIKTKIMLFTKYAKNKGNKDKRKLII